MALHSKLEYLITVARGPLCSLLRPLILVSAVGGMGW